MNFMHNALVTYQYTEIFIYTYTVHTVFVYNIFHVLFHARIPILIPFQILFPSQVALQLMGTYVHVIQ